MKSVWKASRVGHHIKAKTGGLPGLVIMFVFGLVFTVAGGALVTLFTAVLTISMPIAYAIFVGQYSFGHIVLTPHVLDGLHPAPSYTVPGCQYP